ncbi:MAG: FGGY-family carbohydrate kinase [Rhizobiaceae bacterium]
MSKDILIGIDSGTSVVKSVAFDLSGRQIAAASVPNRYTVLADGTASQSLGQTWEDCTKTLRDLAEKVPNLAERVAALAVTGQGDGTWLIDKNGASVGDGWLWLDSRSAPQVQRLRAKPEDRLRFEKTGAGLNSCQQGAQLAYMQSDMPELIDGAETAFHCKDWLYFNLTGERVVDPSEASFTFGNYRTSEYDDEVIEILGLTSRRSMLPPIIDGTKIMHGLSVDAASQTGLLQGTPVSLGYVDVVCTALGAGIYTKDTNAGCTIVGSTGMHMRATLVQDVQLNEEKTGYVMALPIDGLVAQIQSNMASTLNIDWMLNVASDLISDLGVKVTHSELLTHVDRWINSGKAGGMLYHPYISEAGERGPFVSNDARAGFVGLNSSHRFGDMMRGVVEGLGMAARDCYEAMGDLPNEVRLTGGAAKSDPLRGILSAVLNRPVRCSSREEAGAAGAAMMAAVAVGAYERIEDCIDVWVTPLLGSVETPDPDLADIYDKLFPQYYTARQTLSPVWAGLASSQGTGEIE